MRERARSRRWGVIEFTGLRDCGEASSLEKTLKRYVIWTKREGLKIQPKPERAEMRRAA
jgi:hypothetical protein